jgi:hypothetical protein
MPVGAGGAWPGSSLRSGAPFGFLNDKEGCPLQLRSLPPVTPHRLTALPIRLLARPPDGQPRSRRTIRRTVVARPGLARPGGDALGVQAAGDSTERLMIEVGELRRLGFEKVSKHRASSSSSALLDALLDACHEPAERLIKPPTGRAGPHAHRGG